MAALAALSDAELQQASWLVRGVLVASNLGASLAATRNGFETFKVNYVGLYKFHSHFATFLS